jgi:hypothetical protein
MTDYNWFSQDAIEVAVDGIRDEAKKWYGFSDQMDRIASLAASQTLQLSAFAVTDLSGPVTASDLKGAYDKMHNWLTDLFKQAAGEFDNFGKALNKCADWYETTDANAAQNFDEIAAA